MEAMQALRFYIGARPSLRSSMSGGDGSAESRDPRNPGHAESHRLTIAQAMERARTPITFRGVAHRSVLDLWVQCKERGLYLDVREVEKSPEFDAACELLEADLKRRGM